MNRDSADSSLGEFLRQEREKRGITIEQVASATKVGVKTLHALEADHYVDLPAKPFIRGFVTSYARFIGLEPKEVLTRFGAFIDEKALDRPSRDSGHSGYAFEKREGEQSRTILWVVMGSFVLIGGVVMVFVKPSLRHHKQSHVEKLREANALASPSPGPAHLAQVLSGATKLHPASEPSATATAAAAAPKPTPKASATEAAAPKPTPAATTAAAPAAPATPAAPGERPSNGKPDPLNSGLDLPNASIKHKLIITALADVWVRYQCDDKTSMKFMLRKGRILVLRGYEQVRFQVSNPASVSVNANGRTALASEKKELLQRQGTATLLYPANLGAQLQDPFPGEKPLPSTPPPATASAGTVPPAGDQTGQ